MARPVSKLGQIEARAMELIALRGLAQVTIKDIAREAKCAEGALYRHYRSKEEMAWVLFRREVERFGLQLGGVLQAPGDFAERFRAAIELFCLFFDADRTTFSFILLTRHDFPKTWKIRKGLNPDTLVLEFFLDAARRGILHAPDPPLAAAMVLGMVLQPATMTVLGKLKGPMRPRIRWITEACFRVLELSRKKKR